MLCWSNFVWEVCDKKVKLKLLFVESELFTKLLSSLRLRCVLDKHSSPTEYLYF